MGFWRLNGSHAECHGWDSPGLAEDAADGEEQVHQGEDGAET